MAVWGPFAVQAFRDGSFRVLRSGKTRSRPATAQPADLGVYDYAPAPPATTCAAAGPVPCRGPPPPLGCDVAVPAARSIARPVVCSHELSVADPLPGPRPTPVTVTLCLSHRDSPLIAVSASVGHGSGHGMMFWGRSPRPRR